MFYKCKLIHSSFIFYVNEKNLDVIVDYLVNYAESVILIGYLTEEEVIDETSGCFIELKCTR